MPRQAANSPRAGAMVEPVICVVIPTFDHVGALPTIVHYLREQQLPVVIVDDGSREEFTARIDALAGDGVYLLRHQRNLGKGAAVATGFAWAQAHQFTHAVQVDADGQHDLNCLSKMLDCARAHPSALVSGRPVYDASVPVARKLGRYVTHVWVWIETLSFQIADSMCGFRIYPLAATMAVFDEEPVGRRMDFDTDIMVRLFWRGTPVRHVPVPVIYPPGNTSNFRMLADNWRITKMHTRLVLTMFRRLPSILKNRPR